MIESENGKRVLVTGAGGWLGGEVAARLAAAGAVVTGLVHRRPEVRGNDDRLVTLARVLVGDVAAPRLGWTPAAWAAEAGSFDLIVHCAALTQFTAEPELAQAVNVTGTATIAALSKAGTGRLLHVSTAYVNGGRGGSVLESDLPAGPFTNVYEESKAAGEIAVREAGLRAVIARPSIVLGEWASGAVREFGTFYYLLKVLADGWVKRMPAEPGATLDLVPVDHVAAGLMALVERFDDAVGGTFHLVSSAPTPLEAFPDTLAKFPGLAVPAFVPPAQMGPQGRAFTRLIAPYAPYFLRSPRFDDRAFRALTGLVCPPVDAGYWERLVGFALSAGFIGVQASRGGPNGMASEAATPSSAGSR